MTRLGSILFTILGVLFVGFVALMVRLALRSGGDARKALEAAGWSTSDGQRPVRWSATRTRDGLTATLVVKQSGVRQQVVWTELSVPAELGGAEVLVTKRAPEFLSADGVVATFLGERTPPRWEAGTTSFRAALDAWATDEAAGRCLLSESKQDLLVTACARLGPLLGVRFADGRATARLSGEVEDAATVEEIATLLTVLHQR